MKAESPFNPLDRKNLGVSVADALLARAVGPLPPAEPFVGAGIYAIYYTGGFPAYAPIAARNRDDKFEAPIYVGKAVPAGARKGDFGLGTNPGTVLYTRLLNDHAKSITLAPSLDLADFSCRYLVVDDIWIPLAESMLIEMFKPVWNSAIDGFGNHAPGSGRGGQKRSRWDVIHPGRPWAARLRDNPKSAGDVFKDLESFLAGAVTPPPPSPGDGEDEGDDDQAES